MGGEKPPGHSHCVSRTCLTQVSCISDPCCPESGTPATQSPLPRRHGDFTSSHLVLSTRRACQQCTFGGRGEVGELTVGVQKQNQNQGSPGNPKEGREGSVEESSGLGFLTGKGGAVVR